MQVRRSGVCGSDLGAVRHPPPAVGPRGLVPGRTVLGHEFVGDVVDMGQGVCGFAVGDRVTSMAFAGCGACAACVAGQSARCPERRSLRGAYAEYALTTTASCRPVPTHVGDAVAALTEPVAVALHAWELTALADLTSVRVLVLGAGPVGLLIARLGTRRGAARVVVSARGSRRAELVETFADAQFLCGDDLEGAVGQDGFDVVFDAAGAPETLATAVRAATVGGSVVVVATYHEPQTVSGSAALRKELTVRFSLAYSSVDFDAASNWSADDAVALEGLVEPAVGWDGFTSAFGRALRGETTGKIQLDPTR